MSSRRSSRMTSSSSKTTSSTWERTESSLRSAIDAPINASAMTASTIATRISPKLSPANSANSAATGASPTPAHNRPGSSGSPVRFCSVSAAGMAVDLTQRCGLVEYKAQCAQLTTVRQLKAESEENTSPIVTVPAVNAFLVSGPPLSRATNLPNLILYVFSRPGWQKALCGQIVGPPRTVRLPPHLAAKSDSVCNLYLSASVEVTAKAFWLAAADSAPKVMPTFAASPVSADSVCSASPEAIVAAESPLTFLF